MSSVEKDINALFVPFLKTKEQNFSVLDYDHAYFNPIELTQSFEFRDATPSTRTACEPLNILINWFS